MTAREREAALLTRCAIAARDAASSAQDQREANVFQLAASVVGSRFSREAARLREASEEYFATHPDERLTPGDVVRRGWVQNLPRLRDRLSRQLEGR